MSPVHVTPGYNAQTRLTGSGVGLAPQVWQEMGDVGVADLYGVTADHVSQGSRVRTRWTGSGVGAVLWDMTGMAHTAGIKMR